MAEYTQPEAELRQEIALLHKKIATLENTVESDLLSDWRYQARLLASVSDAIITTDLSFCIQSWNVAAEKLYGWSAEEVLGKSMSDILPTTYPQETREQVLQHFWEHDGWQGEAIQRNRHGRVLYLLASVTILRDTHGRAHTVLAINHDITKRREAEQKLQESEQRYKILFEGLPIPTFIWEYQQSDFIVVHVNQAANIITESHAAKFIGLTAQAIYPDRPDILKNLHDCLTTQQTIEQESLYLTRGTQQFRNIVFTYGYAPPNLIIMHTNDTTDLKQAEQKLSETVQDLTLSQQIAKIGGWRYDRATRSLHWSDQMYEIYERPRHLPPIPIEEQSRLFPLSQFEELVQQARLALDNGQPFELSLQINLPSGVEKWIKIIGQPDKVKGSAGHLLQGTVQDITEAKQNEMALTLMAQRLQVQAQNLQSIMDSVPDGLLLLSHTYRIVMANPSAWRSLALLTSAQNTAVGETLTHLGNQPLETILTPTAFGLRHQIEWQNYHYEVSSHPLDEIQPDETNTNWVLVIHDATAEYKIQQQAQQQAQLAIVGQLAAGIAHDFNNILAIINLYIDLSLQQDRQLPTTLRDRLNTVRKQTNRASDLVQQILDFGRRSMMQKKPLDLALFLAQIVKIFERTLPENILMYVQTEPDLMVNGDQTRLQQMIMNLILNARDAMPQGGELHITAVAIDCEQLPLAYQICKSTSSQECSPEWIQLTIQDSGEGISPQNLSHLFEPFFTTKGVGQGTGLGLAQVFGIVKQHGGEIDVSSTLGQGSTFTIYLPALQSHIPSRPPVSDTADTIVVGAGQLILIVEDNLEMQEALVASLKTIGYRTHLAANGQEALSLLIQPDLKIDLVLTDWIMPVMGGKSLLQAMHKLGIDTPVVAITGHSLESEADSLAHSGLVGWLTKPPRLEQLATLLANVLQSRTPR